MGSGLDCASHYLGQSIRRGGIQMKSLKTCLIGCVGGFIALTSAQAADLPVKAKPVEYVKICSLYGVGFYYIPGTDICLQGRRLCAGASRVGLHARPAVRQHVQWTLHRQQSEQWSLHPPIRQRPNDRPRDAHRGCAQPVGIRNDPCLSAHRRGAQQC